MPANSDTTRPTLAMMRHSRAKAETRRLNSSRIRAARPLPVNAPSRAAISCTTTRPTVTRTMKNSGRYWYWAPAEA